MNVNVMEPGASSRKIDRVEAVAVEVPLKQTFEGSVYRITHRTAVIARVHGSDGVIGEGLNMIGERELLPQIVQIIEKEVAPTVVQQPLLSPEACWARMDRVTVRGGRDPRATIRAVACVDTAIWDAIGRCIGQPLYRLWGGRRDTIPIIAIAGYHRDDSLAAFGEEMIELRALGFGGCKFKVGDNPVRDAERVRAAREAVGDDFVLCADANRGWTTNEAIDFCRRVEGLNVRWLEEPCRWRNARNDNRHVRLVTGMAICAGQSELAAEGCRDLMTAGSIDVCNFDASWGAGPTEWNRVAGMAAVFGVQMAHHGEPHLGAHLLGAIEHGTYMETHHPDRDPIFHRMITNRGPFRDGMYRIPDAPGWGVQLDWDAIKHYRLN